MKKIILMLITVGFASCSSDDSSSNDETGIEVTGYSYDVFETTQQGHRLQLTATVVNHDDSAVTGKVRFSTQNGSATGYEYITDVTLDANQTEVVSGVGNTYHPSDEVTFTEVKFIAD